MKDTEEKVKMMMSREKFEWLMEMHDQYKGNARHQQKIIDKLSRKIQKLKKENRELKAIKTMYGREVIIVPDSMAKNITIMNKEYLKRR